MLPGHDGKAHPLHAQQIGGPLILGVGIDIVDIRRIEAALQRFGNRFQKRIYTAAELATAHRLATATSFLAKRWAAKEACSKALGTGMRSGVAWRNIEIRTNARAMPVLALSGGAARRLATLLPVDHISALHVSLSDEPPLATAFVVIEAIPDSRPGRPGDPDTEPVPTIIPPLPVTGRG